MFKKFSNLTLLLVLAGLIGIYLIIQFTSGSSRSEGFRETLVEIDSARVSKIIISGKGNISEITKANNNWKIKIGDKEVPATLGSVKSAINALYDLKPTRLVSRSEDKWTEYQVDSAGTSVKIFEGDNNTLDLVIGRFNVQGRNAYSTYMRLADEPEIYAVNNFMPFSVSADPSNYRDNVLWRLKKDSITTINFDYPDSAFVLEKNQATWAVNGQPADSASIASYLSGLSFVSSRNFYDDTQNLATPSLSMRIATTQKNVKLEAYNVNDEWVFNSSENAESYFKDEALVTKLLKAQTVFSKE